MGTQLTTNARSPELDFSNVEEFLGPYPLKSERRTIKISIMGFKMTIINEIKTITHLRLAMLFQPTENTS